MNPKPWFTLCFKFRAYNLSGQCDREVFFQFQTSMNASRLSSTWVPATKTWNAETWLVVMNAFAAVTNRIVPKVNNLFILNLFVWKLSFYSSLLTMLNDYLSKAKKQHAAVTNRSCTWLFECFRWLPLAIDKFWSLQ